VNTREIDREIDAKVAECLGYAVITNYRHYGENCFVTDSAYNQFVKDYPHYQPPEVLPHFSTTGNGMLLLIEKAREKGILVDFHTFDDLYQGYADNKESAELSTVVAETAPLAVCLAFLKAKGVDVTLYLEGVAAG